MISRQGNMVKLAAVAATAAGLALAPPALAAGGELEQGFAQGGIATLAPGGSQTELYASAAQSDGKVVIAGATKAADPAGGQQTVGLVGRYEADGSLDPSFGNGGLTTIDLGGTHAWLSTADLAIQPDGKVVAAVSGAHGGGHGASSSVLVRLESNGTPDPTFGTGGRVLVPRLDVRGLALEPGGKVVVGGVLRGRDVVARYRSDGSPDSAFGDNGVARTGNSRYLIRDVAVQRDGRIVTAGEECGHAHRCAGDELAATRLRVSGARDRSFTRNGMTSVKRWGHVRAAGANAVAVDKAGRIALAGYARAHADGHGHLKYAVARLRRNGRVDGSFAKRGHSTTGFGPNYPDAGGNDGVPGARAIVADGNELYVGGGFAKDFVAGVIALAAYTPHGALDSGFGHGGKVKTHMPAGNWDSAIADGLAVVPGGRLAAAGYAYNADEEEGGYEGPPHAGAVAMYER